MSQSTSVDMTDLSLKQAQLSFSRVGLGLRSLMLLVPAAYIASVHLGMATNHTPTLPMLWRYVAPSETISLDSILTSPWGKRHYHQKLDDHAIFNVSSDRARLHLCPHSSSWLQLSPQMVLLILVFGTLK